MSEGHQYQLEIAPTLATMTFERAEPNGGAPAEFKTTGALPFFGVSSGLGVDRLGVGATLTVPMVRGGTLQVEEVDGEPAPGIYSLRDGRIQTIWGTAAIGFAPVEKVAIGASMHMVYSSFVASSYRDVLIDLALREV